MCIRMESWRGTAHVDLVLHFRNAFSSHWIGSNVVGQVQCQYESQNNVLKAILVDLAFYDKDNVRSSWSIKQFGILIKKCEIMPNGAQIGWDTFCQSLVVKKEKWIYCLWTYIATHTPWDIFINVMLVLLHDYIVRLYYWFKQRSFELITSIQILHLVFIYRVFTQTYL